MTVNSAVSLDDFVGEWAIERSITDKRGGPNGRFRGTAEFLADAKGLNYSESGHLILDGQSPFKAERRYRWRVVKGTIAVEFPDGRAFHSFDPASPTASHWCDPDTYDVTYDFDLWPVWRSVWDVSGPKKAYQMITDYTRTLS